MKNMADQKAREAIKSKVQDMYIKIKTGGEDLRFDLVITMIERNLKVLSAQTAAIDNIEKMLIKAISHRRMNKKKTKELD